jgi:hypothetical protein
MPNLPVEGLDVLSDFGAWGCPFHGLVVGGSLTLSNGKKRPGYSANFVTYRLTVPGTKPPIRTAAEKANDLINGYQWTNDVICHSDGYRFALHGQHYPQEGRWLYAIAPGNVWAVIFDGFSLDAELNTLTLKRFGILKEQADTSTWEPETRTVPLVLNDLSKNDTWALMVGTVFDVDPTGSRAILMPGVGEGITAENGALLLTIKGDGTDDKPFQAQIDVLNRPDQAKATWDQTPDSERVKFKWRPNYETSRDPPTGCPAVETTVVNTIDLEIQEGIFSESRYVNITNVPIGYWFKPDGSIARITMDVQYTGNRGGTASGKGEAVTPYVSTVELTPDPAGACTPDKNTNKRNYDYQYRFKAKATYTITERHTRILYVDGSVIDRASVEYSYDAAETIDGVAHVEAFEPASVVPQRVIKQRITINGAVWDSRDETAAQNFFTTFTHDWFLGSGYRVDYLPEYNVSTYFYLTAGALDPADRTSKLTTGHYWYANHLLCLAHSDLNKGRGVTYLKTAFPGGIDARTFSQGRVLYGAYNPISGAVTLGQTLPVTYV